MPRLPAPHMRRLAAVLGEPAFRRHVFTPDWSAPSPVRKRPGMYIGDVHDGTGLSHCVWEMVANAVDQHLAGRARNLWVTIESATNTLEVRDDGPGISLERDAEGVTFLDRAFRWLHATPSLDGHLPHVHLTASVFGCGVASVAAVAARLEVETLWRGRLARLVMEHGELLSATERYATDRPAGTRVRFKPDPEIFSSTIFAQASIRDRLQEVAWWLPALRVSWQGEELPGLGGAEAWVRSLGSVDPVIATHRPVDDVVVDVAIGFASGDRRDVRAWANLQPTSSGTHERGLVDALVAIARHDGVREKRERLEARLTRGLMARLHVWLLAPEFGSPTADQLRSPAVRPAVARAIVSLVAEQGADSPFRRALRGHLEG